VGTRSQAHVHLGARDIPRHIKMCGSSGLSTGGLRKVQALFLLSIGVFSKSKKLDLLNVIYSTEGY